MSIADRPYLWDIYDTRSRFVILKTARQVEKTSTIGAKQVTYLVTQPYRSSLYVAPRPDYVRLYSSDRFKQYIEESPVLRPFLRGRRVTDQVHNKVLFNYSKAYFRVAYLSPDKARSITAESLAIDEMQEMISDHIPVIEQTQAHLPITATRTYAGTPLSFHNPLQAWWDKSTKKEWVCKCSAGHSQWMGINNIGKDGPICNRMDCRRPMNVRNGQWVERVKHRLEGGKAAWDGYHFNQLMVPWYLEVGPDGTRAWDELIRNYEEYPEGKFRNEVLGESWRVAEALLTEEEVLACCRNYRMTHKKESTVRGPAQIFAGLDWGGYGKSRTALAIGAYFDGRFHLLDGYFFRGDTPESDVPRITKLCLKWGVSWLMCDAGNGQMQNRVLRRNLYPKTVSEVHFSGSTVKPLTYDYAGGRFVASRNELLKETLLGIKEQRFGFPVQQDMKPFVPDLISLKEEYLEKTRQVKYDHAEDETDDFMFALTLAHTGWQAHAKKIRMFTSKGGR
jgi:hypothetical protein